MPRKPATQPKPEESPSDRFKRVGAQRVSDVLTQLRRLEHMPATGRYEYTEAQVDLMRDKLLDAVGTTIEAYRATDVEPPTPAFSFEDADKAEDPDAGQPDRGEPTGDDPLLVDGGEPKQ
jgi:hypothetical protein